jgi:hypothetical protein
MWTSKPGVSMGRAVATQVRLFRGPAAEAQSPTPPPPAPLHAPAHPPSAGSSQSVSVRGELAIGVWR